MCIYGTVVSLFDEMQIHSMESDALGRKWTDHVTPIATDRQARTKGLPSELKPI